LASGASITPSAELRIADHQRPVDLARRTAGESLGKTRRSPRRAGDQQDARGVLVEPVDKPRAGRAVILDKGIEQAVDMLGGLAAALRGEAGGLVEHDRGGRLADHHIACLGDLFGRERAGAGGGFLRGGRILSARRHAQLLAGGQAIFGLGALAIHPDLPGARPARHGGKADLRQVALEPAVKPDAVVILGDGELADVVGGRVGGHAAPRIIALRDNSHRPPPALPSPRRRHSPPQGRPGRVGQVTISRLKALKVVNPPSTPTPSSRRRPSFAPWRANQPTSTPIARLRRG
jgi:hypothetical protein